MKKATIRDLRDSKAESKPISWLTCYDYSFAKALGDTELDMILVGDSGGMVALGYSDTAPVTMDEMLQMAKAVRRGAPNKFIVGDMPKGSYEQSDGMAIMNAMRFVKEAGCDAVKLEGAGMMADRIRAITSSGIAVIGHVGLTPQSTSLLGGYRVVGRDSREKSEIISQIASIEAAGAVGVLLEATPPNLARNLATGEDFLVLGIGAGPEVDGQLLILHDMLGLYPDFRPKFAKSFVPEILSDFMRSMEVNSVAGGIIPVGNDGLFQIVKLAVAKFISETTNRNFPAQAHWYKD